MLFRRKKLLFVVRILQNLQMHSLEKSVEFSLLQKVAYVVTIYTLGVEKVL